MLENKDANDDSFLGWIGRDAPSMFVLAAFFAVLILMGVAYAPLP